MFDPINVGATLAVDRRDIELVVRPLHSVVKHSLVARGLGHLVDDGPLLGQRRLELPNPLRRHLLVLHQVLLHLGQPLRQRREGWGGKVSGLERARGWNQRGQLQWGCRRRGVHVDVLTWDSCCFSSDSAFSWPAAFVWSCCPVDEAWSRARWVASSLPAIWRSRWSDARRSSAIARWIYIMAPTRVRARCEAFRAAVHTRAVR